MKPIREFGKRIGDTLRSSGYLWTASLVLDRAGFGALRLWPDRTVSPETLATQIAVVLRAWGMPEEHISTTVDHLIYADLRGIDSHGCGMLLSYHRDLVAGRLTVAPKIEVIRDSPTTALMDAGGGLGHVPGEMAMRLAIAKCRDSGMAAVAVRNSGHFGAAGAYALLAAQAGFIGVATTNTRLPAVVPTFGLDASLGTNPIAFAAPAARNQPFLLDMATSTAPLGKLMTAWRSGRSIPKGWAIDDKGRPVTNAGLAARQRRLTPLGSTREMGSHKGYGLAAMVEILSSVLPGPQPARGDAEGRGAVGHFFLALDPARFRHAGEFESHLDGMVDSLRASKPARSDQPVLVAGDPEYAAHAERSRSGIPLSRGIVEDIRGVCRVSGAPFLLGANQ